MAKSKEKPSSKSAYFRAIYQENPELLDESPEVLLDRWQKDHPGEELTPQVRNSLANVKTQERTMTAADKHAGQQSSLPLYRFSVEQYHRMIETGVFNGNERVELLEGWVIAKVVHNPPHDGTVTRIYRRLMRVLSEEWLIRIQCSITTKDSEPEPDLAVVPGPEEVYFSRHPTPQDIALLVEVADATLDQDRREKSRLYARARISVYWIANLVDGTVEVYTEPRAGKSPAYRRRQDYTKQDSVPLVIGGQDLGVIPVRELLP